MKAGKKPPQAWAELRFSVVSGLLASPPPPGQLQNELMRLSTKRWLHPVTGEWISFGSSTIERWYYKVRDAQEPLKALTRRERKDRGSMRVMAVALLAALYLQYKEHIRWSYKLHADNVAALVRQPPELGSTISFISAAVPAAASVIFPAHPLAPGHLLGHPLASAQTSPRASALPVLDTPRRAEQVNSPDGYMRWRSTHDRHGCRIVVCSGAGKRRIATGDARSVRRRVDLIRRRRETARIPNSEP